MLVVWNTTTYTWDWLRHLVDNGALLLMPWDHLVKDYHPSLIYPSKALTNPSKSHCSNLGQLPWQILDFTWKHTSLFWQRKKVFFNTDSRTWLRRLERSWGQASWLRSTDSWIWWDLQQCISIVKARNTTGGYLYCCPPVWLVWNQLYDNWHFFCFYLQNRLIQASKTGGQWYSDTSLPFSIPWLKPGWPDWAKFCRLGPIYKTFYGCNLRIFVIS